MGSDESYGNNGAFRIPLSPGTLVAVVIATDQLGWEHVSVHMVERGKTRTPVWDEMCRIKDLFWGDDDLVVQYHPTKENYVNQHPHTLHLWRPTDQEVPSPPWILVGLKDD